MKTNLTSVKLVKNGSEVVAKNGIVCKVTDIIIGVKGEGVEMWNIHAKGADDGDYIFRELKKGADGVIRAV